MAAPLRAAAGLRPLQPTPRSAERGAARAGSRRAARCAVAVAASGGRRLDARCCTRTRARRGARSGVAASIALHVHHGAARRRPTRWLAHVQRAVRGAGRARGLAACSCRSRRLPAHAAAGDSVEAWARARALRGAGRDGRASAAAALVLLAHHRRDQAETLPAAGAARRRPGRAGGDAARGARATASRWARPLAGRSRAQAIERLPARGTGCATSRTRATPTRVRRATACARQVLAGAGRGVRRRRVQRSAARAPSRAADGADGAGASWRRDDLAALRRQARRRSAARATGSRCLRRRGAAELLRAWLAARWLERRAHRLQTLVRRLCAELPRQRAARWPAPGGGDALRDRGRRALPVRRTPAAPSRRPRRRSVDLSAPAAYRAARAGAGALRRRAGARGGVAAELAARSARVRARGGGEQFQPRPAPRRAA
ncbi:MAG: hypothetical protein MZW92_81135 [Comamonadaceae bacterium]|nr:hypothetical protein [Comamonadaceae bacterium]